MIFWTLLVPLTKYEASDDKHYITWFFFRFNSSKNGSCKESNRFSGNRTRIENNTCLNIIKDSLLLHSLLFLALNFLWLLKSNWCWARAFNICREINAIFCIYFLSIFISNRFCMVVIEILNYRTVTCMNWIFIWDVYGWNGLDFIRWFVCGDHGVGHIDELYAR